LQGETLGIQPKSFPRIHKTIECEFFKWCVASVRKVEQNERQVQDWKEEKLGHWHILF
jgi:hypothetical protein